MKDRHEDETVFIVVSCGCDVGSNNDVGRRGVNRRRTSPARRVAGRADAIACEVCCKQVVQLSVLDMSGVDVDVGVGWVSL